MPTTDPGLINQALTNMGSSYRVPVPTPMSGGDAIAQQDALLAAQQQADLGMAGLGPQAIPPEQVMSVPPPTLPAEENVGAAMSEPIMSGYGGQPAPAPAPAPEQRLPSARGLGGTAGGVGPRMGGGGGAASPLQQAAKLTRAYKEQGDLETARLQQAAEDVGAAREGTYADVAQVQKRLAGLGDERVERLATAQAEHEKVTAQAQAEMNELSSFMANYEPKDRRTTGKKVMSALAVGLSQMTDQNNLVAGLMQGMNVQTNNADQVSALIQRGIDRDLDMQRQMLDNKRTAHAAKNTELGRAREQFSDRMDADKVAYAMKLEQASQEIEALKAGGLSKEAAALADETQAKIGLERANALQQISAANENRLRQQAAAAAAARARAQQPMSTKEALELEGKALANEKARRELAGGDVGKSLTPEQQKARSFLEGYSPDAQRIATSLASGESVPGGAARAMPDIVRGTETLKTEASENALIEANLRVESGASISEGDVAAKRKSLGLDSSDPEVRAEGRRKLLGQYNAKWSGLGGQAFEPIVRRGAAR